MKAEILQGKSIGGNRAILSKEIPLETPYIVQIFPIYGCNFKCVYCIHSLETSKRGFVTDTTLMDFEMYKKCIDDISEFPQKLKMLRFGATGEPLLHPKISEMVEYASNRETAHSIDIVTNASLLTRRLSDRLVNAGLNWLRVSIQGLNSKKYKGISCIDIDFDRLVENLGYFYVNKKNTKLYIKIIDVALDEGEYEKFLEIFGDICDKIAIEYLLPAVPSIDYTLISNKDFNLTQNGIPVRDLQVCPQPFYMMQINPDGNITPCCSMETAYIAGNCTKDSLFDIWNGEKYKNFQLQMLKKERYTNRVCRNCQSYKFGIFDEDVLDDDAEKLIKLLDGG
ncbi:MAG: radical SAM/SPASM domain-containing protein [Candidatus Xenobiia bacterium LiM19]